MSEPKCDNCKEVILRKANGYHRYSLKAIATKQTAAAVFPNLPFTTQVFLCPKCCTHYREEMKKEKGGVDGRRRKLKPSGTDTNGSDVKQEPGVEEDDGPTPPKKKRKKGKSKAATSKKKGPSTSKASAPEDGSTPPKKRKKKESKPATSKKSPGSVASISSIVLPTPIGIGFLPSVPTFPGTEVFSYHQRLPSVIKPEPVPTPRAKMKVKLEMKKGKGKRKGQVHAASVPSPKKSKSRVGRPTGTCPLSKAFDALERRNFFAAIQNLMLLKKGKAAIYKFITKMIKTESKLLLKDEDGPFRKQLTNENLDGFSWEKAIDWVSDKAPVTLTSLQAMFPDPDKLTGQHRIVDEHTRVLRTMTIEEATALLSKRIGMIVSMVHFTCSIKRNFVQAALAVDMWKQGCSDKTFRTLNNLGVSQSKPAAKKHVERLCLQHDKELTLWKSEVEKPPIKRKLNKREVYSRASAYSLAFNQVQLPAQSSTHQGIDHESKTVLCAYQFGTRNRVNFGNRAGPAMKAVEVSPANILPSQQTYESLRQRMITLVMRIIADNLTALDGPRAKVVRHIKHDYAKEMKEKSCVVNIGVVSENPGSEQGVVKIMDGLRKYVPAISGELYPIICCGNRPDGSTQVDGFAGGLVEAPQEFNKELIFFQDMMDLLMPNNSVDSRGTLAQIKSSFSYTFLRKAVKDNIECVWDFVVFVVGAYITLLVTDMYSMKNVKERPADYPDDANEQMAWLSKTAQKVVDLCWMPPCLEDLKIAALVAAEPQTPGSTKEIFPYCTCGEEKDGEPMVQCSSHLCWGVWFHKSCLVQPSIVEESCVQMAVPPSTDEEICVEVAVPLSTDEETCVQVAVPPSTDESGVQVVVPPSADEESCVQVVVPLSTEEENCVTMTEPLSIDEDGCGQMAEHLTVEEDWFCSTACKDDGSYVYCVCKKRRGGKMVQCARTERCKRNRWYHEECLTTSEKALANQPTWYCSGECRNASRPTDHVLNYSKAVIWEGLYNMARRDAVREGDGEAITNFWKSDMVLFWGRRHSKDFNTGHQLLRGIEGFYPERVREDLKWNRVANLTGQPGGNIGFDLVALEVVNELQNSDFRDIIQRSKHMDEQIGRYAHMSGSFGKDMDRLFRTLGVWQAPKYHLGTVAFSKKQRGDIAKFVKEYKKDKLFQCIPGRSHEGFQKFTYPQRVKDPQKMGRTMRILAEQMDAWQQ